jgi:two-component system, OmpR family, response regulator
MSHRKLKRILHIDDEPDISAVVAYALRKLGHYEVCSANSGYLAVELAKEFRPDLILLDVMMPGMDGIQTVTALHADQATAGIPVVYLTAKVQSHEFKSLQQTGVAAVLSKPFDPEGLCRELETVWMLSKAD